MLIIHYAGVRPDMVKGESWKQLDQATSALGQVYLTDAGDNHRIIVNKGQWVKVDEWPEDKWAAMIEDQRKAAEDQAKVQADAEKKRKADAALATFAHLEGRKLSARLKRFFHRVKHEAQVAPI